MTDPNSSRVLRAVADEVDGSALVAISSLAKSQQAVKLECIFEQGTPFSKVIELGAGETIVTEACGRRTFHVTDFPTVLLHSEKRSLGAVGIALTSSRPGGIAADAACHLK